MKLISFFIKKEQKNQKRKALLGLSSNTATIDLSIIRDFCELNRKTNVSRSLTLNNNNNGNNNGSILFALFIWF